MNYRKQRLPSAGAEFDWFCQTYGRDACEDAKKWIDAITRAPGEPVTSQTIEELGEELLEEVESPGSKWQHVKERFADASVRERLRALLVIIRERQPPWQLFVSTTEIMCLGHVPIVLYAYYEVDRVNRKVVFQKFDFHGEKRIDLD